MDVSEHMEDIIHGARLYILNETDDTIPTARRHMKVYVSFNLSAISVMFIFWCFQFLSRFVCSMYFIDRLVRLIFLGLFIYFVGGAIFGTFFPFHSMTAANTIVESLDANVSI